MSRRYAKDVGFFYLYSPLCNGLKGPELKNAIVTEIKLRKQLGAVPLEDNKYEPKKTKP